MVSAIIEAVGELRIETLLIPPFVIGYVGYLWSDAIILGAAFVSLTGGSQMYQLMKYLKENHEHEPMNPEEIFLLFPASMPSLYAFLATSAWYAVTIPFGYILGGYTFYITNDFYLFIGMSAYSLWLILTVTSIERSEEPTTQQLRVMNGLSRGYFSKNSSD
ncbi:hypothetical protein GRS48_14135 [Halorubrum sp. JWXQ-INN 858]|uniref:hypothetical protein n=1 Tax=Halorubrum sp. JWXQ-INN 858 TaxID=2690782 RepID=UPI00135B0A57|nr:hypothetical protein [Halorubrum sp. JWXQ-INN 858]MWV65947.1 hypothetical protein [Halorubrum sp. JWXQ-INN 858]